MAWTDKMVEELKKLWNQGITTGEIGRRLGISKNSIVGKVHRLGLEGRPSPIKKGNEDDSNVSSKSKADKTSKAKDKAKATDKKVVKETKSSKNEKAVKAENKLPKVEDKKLKDNLKPLKKTVVAKEKKSKDVPSQSQLELDIKVAQVSLNSETKQDKTYKENVTLTELDNHTCRWPIGDPKDEDFRFCGCKVKTGQTYCEEHSAIAYVKPVRK